MRFYIACILFCLTTVCNSFGQAYKYIGVTEGLSDRRVLSIQKDKRGFMWFLTYTGIDRYDGKNFKHYRLQSEQGYISLFSEKNILKTDRQGNIWAIGEHGDLFVYDQLADKFTQKQLPQEIAFQHTECVVMTDFDEVWYSCPDHCYTYNLHSGEIQQIQTDHKHNHITSIYQYDKNTYFIGSEDGICRITLQQGKMVATECIISSEECKLPQLIYIHPGTNRLMAYSEKNGMIVYDLTLKRLEMQYLHLRDFPVTGFSPYEDRFILIPTRGAGIYRYDLKEKTLEQYLHARYDEPNKMNGNNIRALYIDEEERLWMSVYARSITVFDKNLPPYTWYKKNTGNPNSLNDDLVNAVLEDKDGNIWFATNNGLNIYNPFTKTWKHLFEWDPTNPTTLKDCIFLSLYEINDGHIIAGGFMTGVYSIDKKTLKATLLTPESYKQHSNPNFANNYIRVIYQDSEGLMWTGGNYYLGCVDNKNQTFKDYFIGSAVTSLLEIDSNTLLVGTGDGMYKMDKDSLEIKKMRMPFASEQINDMYMHTDGDLYIGTTNSGLVILHANGEYSQYRMETSALLSNIVNEIIPKDSDELVIVTEQNVAMFNIQKKSFRNWTDDMGLIKTNFNPRAGVHTSRGTFIVGTGNGAIEWSDTMKLPRQHTIPIIIDQVKTTNRHTAHEIPSHSTTDTLRLPYDENTLALNLTTIDYYTPSYTYFKWKLEGQYDYWRKTTRNSWLDFRYLKPGEYTLHIQNIAREDYRILDEERLKIIIEPSFWHTGWASIIYLLTIGLTIYTCWQILRLRINWSRAKKKLSIFTRNAQSLQTPIALIKAAISEVAEHEPLTAKGQNLLHMVNHNANSIQKLTSNLINIERQTNKEKRGLPVSLHPLDRLVSLYTGLFTPLAAQKNVVLKYQDHTSGINVWVNPQKMELVFYNLFANIIRYTPPEGEIHIHSLINGKRWEVTVSNDIDQEHPAMPPADEALHMNKEEFASELSIIYQLVGKHHGNLHYEKSFPGAYTFEISFPMEHPEYKKENDAQGKAPMVFFNELWAALRPALPHEADLLPKLGHILLVNEDSDDIYSLDTILNSEWDISTAHSTETALNIIQEILPDAIITTFITPEHAGEDLCSILKSNVATSHIPIIMLTNEEEKEQLEKTYKLRPDHYISTPQEMQSIRIVLKNMLDNHKSRKDRLEQTDTEQTLKEIKDASIEQESHLLTEIKELVRLHIDNPDFSVDDLCNLMGMSRTSLYNKMKSLTTQSPSDIIRETRMKRAAEMLLTNKYTIMEVSDHMGFSEPKYFREVFKKHFGITPSEYIKKEIGK